MSEELEVAPGENTSGQGKESVLPDELKGWNWGAFLMNWIWGLFNGTYIALLMFVPFVNLVWGFVLGAKGNKWAWANKSWDDVDHFRRVQRKWAWAGVIVLVSFTVLFSGAAGYGIWAFNNSDIRVMAAQQTQAHPEVAKVLGEPIEPGWWTGGEISRDGEGGGNADITFSVTGPKGEGKVRATGILEGGKWRITRMSLYDAAEKEYPLVEAMAASQMAAVPGKAPTGEKPSQMAGQKTAPEAVPEAVPEAAKPLDLEGVREAIGRGEAKKSLPHLRFLASQGNPEAQLLLGDLFMEGRGIYQNYSMAGNWYKKAAQAGNAESQFKLAVLYQKGLGVPLYIGRGRELLISAAQQGHAQAIESLKKQGIEPPPMMVKEGEDSKDGKDK